MEKKKKITVAVAVVLVVIFAAVALTLFLVKTKPLAELSSYAKATVYTGGTMNSGYTMTEDVNEDMDKKFRAELENCSYSLFQQMVTGKVDNFNLVKDGEDVVYTIEQLGEAGKGLYTDYDTSLPLVELSFGKEVTFTIGRSEYTFDTVQFLVADTEGQVREITCVAYTDADFDKADEETSELEYNVFRFYANTSSLYSFIQDNIA